MNAPKKLTRKEKDALSRQASSAHPAGNKKKSASSLSMLLPAILVFTFGFLLYAGTLRYDYTLDDFAAINSNRIVQKGAGGIGELLHSAYWSGFSAGNNSLYRPLSLVLFALEWEFFPGNPAAGHFINVFLYALTGALLFRLLNKLFNRNILVSFTAAMLFVAHPVHTEVVANIKSSDEILCLLFCITSLSWLIDYVDTRKSSRLLWSVISFFLALLSKENAITWLAVLPLSVFIFRNMPARKAMMLTIPFGIAALLYLAILTSIQHGMLISKPEALTNNVLSGAPDYAARLATAFFVLGRYLWLLVFPLHLSMDYSFAAIRLMSFGDARVLVSLGCIAALLATGVYLVLKRNTVGFGILYFFITISVVSNIVFVIGTVMADRLLYMPSLGLAMAAAVLLSRIGKESEVPGQTGGFALMFRNRVTVLLGGTLLLLYSARTVARNPVWENNLSLFASGMKDAPDNAYVHYLYSNELIKSITSEAPADSLHNDSVYAAAISGYSKAIAIDPRNASFYNELAATYRKKNRPEEAMKYYDMALKRNSRLPQTYNGKGVILFEQKRYSEALNMFAESVRLNATDATALRNLGGCNLVLGNNRKAIENFEKALTYDPSDPLALKYMGFAYQNLGDTLSANDYFQKSNAAQSKMNR